MSNCFSIFLSGVKVFKGSVQARSVKAGKCTLLLFEQIFKNGNLKFHFLIIMMNNFDTVAQVFQNKDKTFSNWKSFYTKWKDTSGCVKQWSVLAVLLFHRYSFRERNHACCTSVFPFLQWIVCSLQTLAYWPMWNKTLIIHCKERPDCYYMVESIWFVHTKWDQTLRVQQASTTKRDEHSQIYHHWDVVCTRLYCLMRLRFQSHP